jgi:hypothetical protein
VPDGFLRLPLLLQGLRLLSAGADRSFRVFSTIQDQQSRELSQKNTAARAKRARVTQQELKLPRVTQLAACEVGAAVVSCSQVLSSLVSHGPEP